MSFHMSYISQLVLSMGNSFYLSLSLPLIMDACVCYLDEDCVRVRVWVRVWVWVRVCDVGEGVGCG